MPARRPPAPERLPGPGDRVVRVLPDVVTLGKSFDYLLPDANRPDSVVVGARVRVYLAGRRVGGWIVETDVSADPARPLRPLERLSGPGPEPHLIGLAEWAAWRWAGRPVHFLRTASPDFAVMGGPSPSGGQGAGPSPVPPAIPAGPEPVWMAEALTAGGAAVVQLPPAEDLTPVVARVAQLGPTLVIVPTADRAAVLADRLRRAGGSVALLPADWAMARAGAAVVIGTRAAAWAPCPGLAAVIVVDGHEEGLVQTQSPTWDATTVAIERARRAGVPCVVTSPCATLELLAMATVFGPSPAAARQGWAPLEVIDRSHDDPHLGLYSAAVADLLRAGGRVVCVLNRTGRARLLACGSCGELGRCEACGAPVALARSGGVDWLVCARCGMERPVVCAACGSFRFKQLRIGVSRAREEMEVLAGRLVGEVTAATKDLPTTPVLVGTESVLHRVPKAEAVAFLDFDQELLAPRYRASEEALAMLARASRIVGGRTGRVLVQTRLPDHEVIRAAVLADPGRLAIAERPVREMLGLPPASALAVISGEGAAAYVSALGERLAGLAAGGGTHLVEWGDKRWLLRSPSHQELADVLAAVPRPPGRLRLEVDPIRL